MSDASAWVVGIHTNGGCSGTDENPLFANSGTLVKHPAPVAAMAGAGISCGTPPAPVPALLPSWLPPFLAVLLAATGGGLLRARRAIRA